MKRYAALVLCSTLTAIVGARADSSVVFNEIMYHPATNEPALEWVELYSQMAVDVDMSGWSLDGDIHYTFSANTILHGGNFLVVAVSPTNLAALTGLTNVLGPFTNRLSNGGGHLLLRNNNGRLVNSLDYDTSGDWPVASDGSGVSLAKLDHSTASDPPENWAASAQIGGTPGRENFPTNSTPLRLAFNEVSATTNADFWLELLNYGTNSLAIGGYVIVRDGVTNGEYVLSPGITLPVGGFLTLSNTTLGFHPVANDRLYLLPAARTNVVDAVQLKSGLRGRSPDGAGPWLHPATPTPGASNSFIFHTELVINEIMYHHQLLPALATNLPPQASDEEWVELFNQSTNSVNLTGWHLEGGISYDFLQGKSIAPGAYLLVARDAAALRTRYPAIDIVGDYSGKLSGDGDLIVLDDGADNPADRVRYYTSGRWPEHADGGGSSLELRDPRADNSKAEAWSASDESAKSSWVTNSYQAVAQTVVGPEQWNDFITGLLNHGECFIDDVSVIESPGGTAVQFIANGNFENGAAGWRFLGNHMQSRVETEPGNPANHVLHLIATGPQEDLHNHIETTYTGGRSVVNGRVYQISYRAKWLAGNNMLNTRLYYERVAKSIVLPSPMLNGTPGAQNSRYATNIGPTFSQFQQGVVIPAASQAVTVSAVVADPQGVSSSEVWWSANGAAFAHAAMTAQAGGLYTGTIPGFASGTIVQFYIRAVDALGAASTFPAGGSNSGALYMVADGQANLSLGHNLRVIISPANWALMRAATNLMSDASLPCTMVYDEQKPYYDIRVRLKGSESGRWYDPRPGFHLEFQPDDMFRGVHSSILINTSGRGSDSVNKQGDIVVHHIILHAGGLPDIHRDMSRMIMPYNTNTGPVVICPRYEDEFIKTAFENGGDGTEWVMELSYYPTTTNSAGYKLPNPQLYVGPDLSDLGNDKETYRYNFLLKNHRAEDDYSRFIPFSKTFDLPFGPVLDAQSKQVMDVNEWLRAFALVSLLGEGDWYTFGPPHNLMMYLRPTDNRMIAFLWDIEHPFTQSASAPLIGSANWSDIANLPGNKRRLFAHALDIIATTYNTSYLAYWTAHYATFAPGQSYAEYLSYIPSRIAAVNSEINSAGGNSAFAISGTNFIVTSGNLVTLSGTAPILIQSLRINGVEYPITWNSVSSWTVSIPVSAATNVLSITAYDLNGNLLTNYTSSVTVKLLNPAPDPAGAVVLNEILYNPILPGATFVELRNTSTNSFDLSNWRVNGLGYNFPSGSIITNRQYLVLAGDQSAYINAYGTTNVAFDAFPGNLQTNGETLTLLMPAVQTNQPEVVVDKVKYAATAPWPPTTPGFSLQLKDPAQDHFRVGNWAVAPRTPAASNSVSATLTPFAPLWINEVQAENLTGITNRAGQRTPWLEIRNSSTNVVSLTNLYLALAYTNLTAWSFPTGTVLNPGQFKIVFADGQTNLSTTNEPHTSFTLASGAGSLALSRIANSQAQVLDYVDYTNLTANRSFGSYPDGQSFDRFEFYHVTPGASNDLTSAPLSVVINEWMAGNTHTLTNPLSGKYSDWFELYNYGTNPANLAGYYLTDSLTNQFDFQIPAGYIIPPLGFLLVIADGRSTNGTPELHVTFKLSKSGESLGLYGADGNPVDFVNYGPQADDVSEGRFPDGAADRFFMPTATPRTNNVIPNTAPVITTPGNRFIHAGQTFGFTASATDPQSPPQSLVFSLEPGAPAGASIGASSGAFLWAATNTPVPGTNNITIRVTDNGTPPLSSVATFSVTVLPLPQFAASRPVGALLPFSFSSLPGQTYQIQFKDNLADLVWSPLGAPVPGTGGILQATDIVTGQTQRFYRLAVLP